MTSDVTIFHNPKCSKSRETLDLLRSKDIEPNIIEYLTNPPTIEELRTLVKQLGSRPAAIVRTKEDIFIEANIDLDNDEAILQFLNKNPRALERPIVVKNGKAAIGRPPENVLAIL